MPKGYPLSQQARHEILHVLKARADIPTDKEIAERHGISTMAIRLYKKKLSNLGLTPKRGTDDQT